MNITYVGPFNTTGYGYASAGYLKIFDQLLTSGVIKSLEYVPIGSTEVGGTDLDEYLPLVEKYKTNSPTYSNVAVCFWHLGHIHQAISKFKYKIGMSTFELSNLNDHQIRDANLLDYFFSPSNFVDCVLNNSTLIKVHSSDYYPAHLLFDVSKLDYAIPESLSKYWSDKTGYQFSDSTMFVSNIGKFEKRKGHYDLIDILETAVRPTTLIAYWFNPFLPSKFPYSELSFRNWKCTTNLTNNIKVYSKGSNNIVLMPPEARRVNLYNNILRTHLYLDTSKAEGFNLPLRDLVSAGMPLAFTGHTANEEVVPKYRMSIFQPLRETEPAIDGTFFNDPSIHWSMIDKVEYLNHIESFDIKDKTRAFSTAADVLSSVAFSSMAGALHEVKERLKIE